MIQGIGQLREAYRDERVAADYVDKRFREPLGALLHDRQAGVLKQVIATWKPNDVLEIAPGPARLTVEIAPMLRRGAVLIDASAQMLAEARRRLAAVSQRARLVEGDAFQLPFTGMFDLVYTFRLIRHFEWPERVRLYRQIRQALRPGGVLVFDAVNETVSQMVRSHAHPGEYPHYDALLRPDGLARELRDAGFAIVSLTGVQHRYPILQRLQTLVAPRSRALARYAMETFDRLGGEPLEWVVVCCRG